MDNGGRQAIANKAWKAKHPDSMYSERGGNRGRKASLVVYCPYCEPKPGGPLEQVHIFVTAQTRTVKCPSGHVIDCTGKSH